MGFSEFITACRADEDVHLSHAILTGKRERLGAYRAEPYLWECPRLLFSMTKSFSSLAVGIAWDRGLLSLDDKIADWFREELPRRPHPNLQKIEVRHLLSMTAGIHENTYEQLFPQKDWVRAFLAQDFPHEPGFYYRYSTHGSHMLSALVQKAAGETLEDFLNETLFFPMDIREARWERAPEGLTAGGMGLRLYPGSLEKIARLLLNKGNWQGKQLISQEYLSRAVLPQAFKQEESGARYDPFSGDSYGFQLHLGTGGAYRMDGAFGQVCLIAPEQGLGLVALSQNSRTKRLLELAHRHLLSGAAEPEGPRTDFSGLSTVRTGLFPTGQFLLEENPLGAEGASFPKPGKIVFHFPGQPDSLLEYRPGKWIYGQSRFIWDLEWGRQAHAVFPLAETAGHLKLEVRYLETPYIAQYAFHRTEKGLELDFSVNAGFTLKNFTVRGTRKNRE